MEQRHTDVTAQVVRACPVAAVLDRVAGKWSIGILAAAEHGPVRFTELERSLTGISRRMLALNLRQLERDGLLSRTTHPTVPPKVEYALTDSGQELWQSLQTLSTWFQRHGPGIVAAQEAYDRKQEGADDPLHPAATP
ncbi:winged helix-turn-helix transcriptional regulator [Actinomadura opuntiae]|uniref:winged helix-turn-helix transcriptional regulator n=1 Tax=Actinomadura sp. OS1-43 TaxID=604315 RepID=UPI00255A9898|nr:helix-turn-helix domain-containing protein [Actinomadura sp. OS1-43]MDL4814250.1 helix-turn-helix domain-containing protein [Actinomadura sp. OS1-43]